MSFQISHGLSKVDKATSCSPARRRNKPDTDVLRRTFWRWAMEGAYKFFLVESYAAGVGTKQGNRETSGLADEALLGRGGFVIFSSTRSRCS